MSGFTPLDEALADLSPDRYQALIDNPAAFYEFAERLHSFSPTTPNRTEHRAAIEQTRVETRLRRLDANRQTTKVRRAREEWLSTVGRIDKHDTTIRRLHDTIENATEKRDAITERQRKAAAQALLADKPVPNNAAARKAIAQEGERIEDAESALKIAEPQRAEHEALEREAYAVLCDETNDLVGARTVVALERVESALSKLAPALSELWAADIVRETLIGTKWSFDWNRVRPISGAAIVQNLLASLPQTLLTPAIELSAVEAEAKRIADALVSRIEENPQ